MSCISSSRCFGVSVADDTPVASSGVMSFLFIVRMSPGAVVLMIADVRCAGVERVEQRARRVLVRAENAQPFFSPSRTSAGLVPRNAGELATAMPLTTVKRNET